jgi:hypothetical protein
VLCGYSPRYLFCPYAIIVEVVAAQNLSKSDKEVQELTGRQISLRPSWGGGMRNKKPHGNRPVGEQGDEAGGDVFQRPQYLKKSMWNGVRSGDRGGHKIASSHLCDLGAEPPEAQKNKIATRQNSVLTPLKP